MRKNFLRNCKIILNCRLNDKYFRLVFKSEDIAERALPGQFVEIKVSDSAVPLLRRPLSIHKVSHQVTKSPGHRIKKEKTQDLIELLYEAVGEGTELLSQKRSGECLDVIGPLGNGFSLSHPIIRIPILIAGGMGVAPLLFLAEKLVHSPQSTVHVKPLVLIGARTKDGILCEKDFKKLGCEVKIATDNGSQGYRGKVTDLLKNILSTIDCRLSTIYACGPKPMLKELCNIVSSRNITAQVSLESHMACGIGACLGCVVSTRQGFKRVCKDGPVFSADQLLWEKV